MIPANVVCFCQLCPTQVLGIEAIAEHLDAVHGEKAERWPDGGLVVDASEVPELIGDHR